MLVVCYLYYNINKLCDIIDNDFNDKTTQRRLKLFMLHQKLSPLFALANTNIFAC